MRSIFRTGRFLFLFLAAQAALAESFTFTPLLLADRNAIVTSDTVTAGAAGNLSIVGGEYSINGGAFASDPLAVNAGDTITLRQSASTRYNTTTSAILTDDASASSFDVTTGIRDRITATSGSVRIAGIKVTVTPTVTGTPSAPGCGAAAAPYSLGSQDSYRFSFSRSPFMLLVPVGFAATDPSSMRYTIDGRGLDPHSFTLPGRLAGSDCGPAAVVTSTDSSGNAIVQSSGTSSGVLRARPLFSAVFSNPSTSPVAFGAFVFPRQGTDIDGTGTSDLFLVDAAGSQVMGLEMNGLAAHATSPTNLGSSGWKPVHISDIVNGGGNTDVLWQNDDGRAMLHFAEFQGQPSVPLLGPGDWKVIETPDLDGNGVNDLLFANSDGSVAAWTMSAVFGANGLQYQRVNGATILGPGTGWSVVKIADFDGDGKDDLLWKHTDGRHAIWLMNGITPVATAEILGAGAWNAVQVADLDGDGKADIVWQNADGTIAAWLMDGVTTKDGATLLAAGSGWTVTHAADFNADLKSDLLFRHTDGRAAMWLMDGLTPTAQAEILPAGTGWTARRVGDFNADLEMDIAWQHEDGRIAVWLMDGTTPIGSAEILGPGTGWTLDGLGP
ncbi:MAG TPA: VCBS repeat-containing protein [Usitatibacter sp.]|nr:VCBS repeat-containing protein [Usitatibacter sp.]